MKNIFLVLLSILMFNVYAVDAIALDSEIKKVKVYRQNAEITRVANTKLISGTQEIVITDISTQINPSSLQVQIAGQGNVTLLSAKYERNFLLPKKNNPEIEKLKTSLEKMDEDLSWIKDQKMVYKGMEDILNVNKDFGKSESGFTANNVSDLINNYKNRLLEIRKELISLNKEEKSLYLQKSQVVKQLKELKAKFNKPSGNIVLLVSSSSTTSASFKCTYIVSGAGWNPIYDLRSEGISKDVKLNYKASVYQSTGQNWVLNSLIISTGNPAKNNNRPILTPLYTKVFVAHYNDNIYGDRMSKKTVSPASNMAYEVAPLEIKDEDYNQGFQYTAQTTENQMSVEFEISNQQKISSDGKSHIIPLESYNLETEYIYHTVPKLDRAAFLLAKVSDWGKYNLVSGNANIFFEGAFVGESYLNASITSDTMLLSMGRDESISVQRKEVKEFTETKFLGPNKKETFAYDIIIKNKKSSAIKIEILDQIPVSKNKIISVDLIDKGTANYVKNVGKLLWTINIPAGQSKKVGFKYSVKYPKDEKVTGVK